MSGLSHLSHTSRSVRQAEISAAPNAPTTLIFLHFSERPKLASAIK